MANLKGEAVAHGHSCLKLIQLGGGKLGNYHASAVPQTNLPQTSYDRLAPRGISSSGNAGIILKRSMTETHQRMNDVEVFSNVANRQ